MKRMWSLQTGCCNGTPSGRDMSLSQSPYITTHLHPGMAWGMR